MKTKILSKSINKGSQSIDYKETIKIDDKKLQILIKSDTYDFQSHAYISLWNGEEWKKIDSIHYKEMRTEVGLVHKRCNQPRELSSDFIKINNEQEFKSDRNTLVRTAKDIIF